MVLFNKKERQERRMLLASMDQMTANKPAEIDNAAFNHVKDNITELNGRAGANETDLIFLKGLMDSSVLKSLVKVQDRLEDKPKDIEPVCIGNKELIREITAKCIKSKNRDARELANILSTAHFRALVDTHDEVAEDRLSRASNSNSSEHITSEIFELPVNGMHADAIRMVGLRKNPNEPLGLTVQVDDQNNLVIARILGGGMIDRQGLLHVGDVILEVNGVPVYTPEELASEIGSAKESVTLKIGPSVEETVQHGSTTQCYMRALFDYDPTTDTLLPCREIGLPFEKGDILQIVDTKDPNWWQAKKINGDGLAGLIPSQELEERRKAFVAPEADYVHKISICGARISRKKKKTLYQSKNNGEFDKAELILYEEVTRMPPFKRKTLVFIGPQGVGRRTLKNRLINSDPDKFAAVVPYTSRPPRVLEENGKSYWFSEREAMETEIRNHKFLEYGEHNGHLYGTHLDTIRDVIRQGKMCVLDCSPGALKILHNSTEFMPYVIFIAAPGMEQLKGLYDGARTGNYSSKNLTFDRQSSIRFSSRRARTLESLASLYEEEDLRKTLEESACLQRTYGQYVDEVITNEDFDITFRKVLDALEALQTEHQWVPVNWIY
ncbi:protein PALS2 isoform X2 [Chrysoperla carnea]|uniref:protein PALS2 isoform X2 n=1 Tax=Chrysoperla carnea TaxID=189513 RepID=UPI001D08E707|nr:protein PALS2 isoform X2 [Chrysoperla carnea]